MWINGDSSSSSMFTTALRCRLRFGFLLRSSISVPSGLKDRFRWSLNSTPLMSLNFFNGPKKTRSGSQDSGDYHQPQSRTSNNLIYANVVVYAGQYLSKEKLTLWGFKRNCCIRKGQLWRLVTCAFLHANIVHLLVNCYSLNNIGPVNEEIWGPNRYLTIYITSAVAGSTMSYWFNKSNSLGASGAICGLVGSYMAYILRNRDMIQGSDESLKQIGKVIIFNIAFGLMCPRIDNWAHLGGFIGGAAISCLLDPALKLKPVVRKVVDLKREK